MIIKYLDAQWCGSGPTAVHNGKMLIFCLKTSFISEFKTLLQAKYKSFWFLSFYFNQTYMGYVQITWTMYKLKWDASSRWPFRPNSAWGSIEMVTIEKTRSTL